MQDPWQARMDRLRRLVPLPLLLVCAAGTFLVPGRSRSSDLLHILLVAAAALWSALVTMRLHPEVSGRWRLAVFAVHTVLAAALVWINLLYGVFAYTGFLYSYPLGARWRRLGFAATALVVSAALAGGYPSTDLEHNLTYLLIATVLLALVLNSASITNRALEQNQQRGRTINELAEANRRLEESMAENAELHARLLVQARQAGIVEERQRLAGEIHDTLAQGLTGIIAQLQAAEQTRHRPDEFARHLGQAQSLARDSLTEARRSVRALRPEQLEDASLPEAIAALGRSWSQRSGIAADLHTTGVLVRAGGDVEATLFRVAQEALSNVAKHAGASKVQLTLTYLDDTLLLDVADDGSGFDPAARTEGYGLAGMKRRLTRVDGVLTVESAPGHGTTLNATVPLDATTGGGQG